LKFGIYSAANTVTCAGRPASLGYEVIDALTYAAWGVDYLKYDDCTSVHREQVTYPIMAAALNDTGRPILFSMCTGPINPPVSTWGGTIANSWRTTNDISPNWASIIWNLQHNDPYWQYATSGNWNDPDMLEVGNDGLSDDESVSHFSLWCLIKSPLLLGNDLTSMSARTLEILTNDEVLALSQDKFYAQGHLIRNVGNNSIYVAQLTGKSFGVVLLNVESGTETSDITVLWSDLGVPMSSSATVRDLWQHRDLGSFKGSFLAQAVKSHASVTLRITPTTIMEE